MPARTKSRRPSLKERLARDRLFQTSPDLPRIVEIDLERIGPNPEQPRARLDPATQEELRQSIERHGLLQPILVRRDGAGAFTLVAGQRRLEALRALARPSAPAIVVDGDPGEVALVENLQRQELDALEEARAVARLMERFGYSQTEIGAVLGKRQNTVSALLALNRLPEEIVRDYAGMNGIPRSLMVELAQIKSPKQQRSLWQVIRQGGVTVRDLRAERRLGSGGSERAQHSPTSRIERAARALERLLSELAADGEGVAMEAETAARLRRLHTALGAFLDRPAGTHPQGAPAPLSSPRTAHRYPPMALPPPASGLCARTALGLTPWRLRSRGAGPGPPDGSSRAGRHPRRWHASRPRR